MLHLASCHLRYSLSRTLFGHLLSGQRGEAKCSVCTRIGCSCCFVRNVGRRPSDNPINASRASAHVLIYLSSNILIVLVGIYAWY